MQVTALPTARPGESGLSQVIHPQSALALFVGGPAASPEPANALMPITPFATNLSQREAIGTALKHRLSAIEGPPGTGKTETILNIIATIVGRGLGTVGVVSFSNSAVDNVRDKLRDNGFGHIVAELGKKERCEAFFAGQSGRADQLRAFRASVPAEPPPDDRLVRVGAQLDAGQRAERSRTKLRVAAAALELERRHFQRFLDRQTLPELDELPLLHKSADRILDFLTDTQSDVDSSPGLITRVRRYLRYGRLRGIDTTDSHIVLRLQEQFYARRLEELNDAMAKAERDTEASTLEQYVREQRVLSDQALRFALGGRLPADAPTKYQVDCLRSTKKFGSFTEDYPVILSTCHSLLGNLPRAHLLDYLIIDEASQVDLLSAAMAMAACRRVIIVGDVAQLPQISQAVPENLSPPREQFDYRRQSLLSSVIGANRPEWPTTPLLEHYRCHPMIIGYCNAAFYQGKLIPYTSGQGRPEPIMQEHATAPGNHMRVHRSAGGGRSNQREIDVIVREVLPAALSRLDPDQIVVAAPYRRQMQKFEISATRELDGMVVADTVHKLQGRQKSAVVLTTVLSENREGHLGLRFVDDSRLVNVAVSRAVDHFYLVTNHDRLRRSKNLRNLVGYIEYQYPSSAQPTSAVISVFDVLYREFSPRLDHITRQMNPAASVRSEEALRVLLDQILDEDPHRHLHYTTQVLLCNLVADTGQLDDRQQKFVRHRASLDFVVHNRLSHRPVLAIEVNGFHFHEDSPDQLDRDRIKRDVLDVIGLPLLTLATTESNEVGRINRALTSAEEVLGGA